MSCVQAHDLLLPWFHLCGGVDIYFTPTSGVVIVYNIESVSYCQLLELLTLDLSPNWSIPSYLGRWRSSELDLTRYMTFTLVMDEDSSTFTDEMYFV